MHTLVIHIYCEYSRQEFNTGKMKIKSLFKWGTEELKEWPTSALKSTK